MLLWWWLLSRDEYHRDTHGILMTPLLRSLVRPPCGTEADCHGSPHRVRGMLILWALWCITMMASIMSIAISDGFNCAYCNWRWRCCLLLLITTVPSYNACVVFTARIFNSLITIQKESPSGRPINLIGVCCSLSIGPANHREWNLFTCNFYGRLSSTQSCQSPSKGFDGFVKIEDEAFESMLESPCHSMVDFLVMLVTQKYWSEECNIQNGVSETVWLLLQLSFLHLHEL